MTLDRAPTDPASDPRGVPTVQGEIERWRYRFQGRVQGVGFRAAACDCADGRPVTGWVQNDADGAVSLEIQGMPAHLSDVIERLLMRQTRNIRTADRVPAAPVPVEFGFRIRR